MRRKLTLLGATFSAARCIQTAVGCMTGFVAWAAHQYSRRPSRSSPLANDKESIMRRITITMFAVAAAAVSALALQAGNQDRPPADEVARFTPEGRLIRPKGFEEWVMVGASTGLSYAQPQTPPAAGAAPGMFHNIYLQRWAYRHAMKTGAFPEGAMFVMTFYAPSRRSNPARSGFYEGDRIEGLEV